MRLIRLLLPFIILLILWLQDLRAQISPPGLSDTRFASWFALGLKQRLDKDSKKQSITYVGYGMMSDPKGSAALFDKPSMFILNQEYEQKISKHYSYTGALSYRRQYLYADQRPYASLPPRVRQEFRFYGKLSYQQSWDKFKWNLDFRPEFRKFYGPCVDKADPSSAFRARFKAKATIPLTATEDHILLISAESLFQNERIVQSSKKSWTGFQYNDSRFCLYYRYTPKDFPAYFELGYMNNLVGSAPATSMHHFGLDIVLRDLFSP